MVAVSPLASKVVTALAILIVMVDVLLVLVEVLVRVIVLEGVMVAQALVKIERFLTVVVQIVLRHVKIVALASVTGLLVQAHVVHLGVQQLVVVALALMDVV